MAQSCVSEKLYRRRKLLKRGMWIASIPKFLDSYEEKKRYEIRGFKSDECIIRR